MVLVIGGDGGDGDDDGVGDGGDDDGGDDGDDDDDDGDDGLPLRSLPVSLQARVKHCTSTLLTSTRCQLMEMTAKPGPISLRVARLVLSVTLFTFHSGLAPAASEQRTLGVVTGQSGSVRGVKLLQ